MSDRITLMRAGVLFVFLLVVLGTTVYFSFVSEVNCNSMELPQPKRIAYEGSFILTYPVPAGIYVVGVETPPNSGNKWYWSGTWQKDGSYQVVERDFFMFELYACQGLFAEIHAQRLEESLNKK